MSSERFIHRRLWAQTSTPLWCCGENQDHENLDKQSLSIGIRLLQILVLVFEVMYLWRKLRHQLSLQYFEIPPSLTCNGFFTCGKHKFYCNINRKTTAFRKFFKVLSIRSFCRIYGNFLFVILTLFSSSPLLRSLSNVSSCFGFHKSAHFLRPVLLFCKEANAVYIKLVVFLYQCFHPLSLYPLIEERQTAFPRNRTSFCFWKQRLYIYVHYLIYVFI